MLRWNGLAEVPPDLAGSILTIGTFDGVHRGHQKVISATVESAATAGLPAVVLTFDPHPMTVVRPDAAPPLLASLEHRLERFAHHGVDATLVLPFTTERSKQPAEEFVAEIAGTLHPTTIVVGDDFRYGFKAAGDVDLLRRLGAELGAAGGDGFDVEALSRDAGDAGWSSSAIRGHLAAGEVETAADLLGRPFRVEGVVRPGADRGGRLLGFPTANVPISSTAVTPDDGVYAGWLTRLDDETAKALPAAISVGTNPQFGSEPRRVEAHVIDRDDLELYDVPVAIDFVHRLRGQQTFASLDGLIAQIQADADRTRALLTG